MTDLDRKGKSDLPNKSPRPSNKLRISFSMPSGWVAEAAEAAYLGYEHYLRLPELKKLWSCEEFPSWKNESLIKPALQGLEITFRFVSIALSDPRPYSNRREWRRRLESLVRSQVEIISLLCEDEAVDGETRGTAPIVDLRSSDGVMARRNSSTEVWKLSDETTVVSQTSEASLLPRLLTWRKSEDIARNILDFIESEMRSCPYTLGLGEPNLDAKPILHYDAIVKPSELHSLKKNPSNSMNLQNFENQTLYTTHQIFETWIYASKSILNRIAERIESKRFGIAASDCWILEKTWRLLTEIEELHLLMDPDDFLRLKNQLSIKTTAESQPLCFRSRGLVEMTKLFKDLKHKIPCILDVEADPNGGPRVQEAAMKMYAEKEGFERIHLVQGLQAIELSLKRFYYSYKQLLMVVMGSLEAGDSLDQIFLEPTYFPSLDAAKTFLGELRSLDHGSYSP